MITRRRRRRATTVARNGGRSERCRTRMAFRPSLIGRHAAWWAYLLRDWDEELECVEIAGYGSPK